MDANNSSIRKSHHEKDNLCTTRPKYRDGRMLKAVKVYTVIDESHYLLIRGLSVVHGALEGLLDKLSEFGDVVENRILTDYPLEHSEQFTQVLLVKFARIPSARIAKKKLDDLNYLGEVLHVCYAPEFESVEDTRDKLEERRRTVTKKMTQKGGGDNRNNRKVARPRNFDNSTNHSHSNGFDVNFTSNDFHSKDVHTDPSLRLIPTQIQKSMQNSNVNATLKRNAMMLSSEVQGPRLPDDDEERRRKAFHHSEMGDQSLDQSQHVIRKKMKLNNNHQISRR